MQLSPEDTRKILESYRTNVREIALLMTDITRAAEKHTRYRRSQGWTAVPDEVRKQQDHAEFDMRSRARRLEAMRSYVKPAIDLLPYPLLQTILIQRYMFGKSWTQIGALVHLERTTIWRYHREALERLQWPDGSAHALMAFIDPAAAPDAGQA